MVRNNGACNDNWHSSVEYAVVEIEDFSDDALVSLSNQTLGLVLAQTWLV